MGKKRPARGAENSAVQVMPNVKVSPSEPSRLDTGKHYSLHFIFYNTDLRYLVLFQSKHSCFWCSLLSVSIRQHVSTLLFLGHHQVSPFFVCGSFSTCCPTLTDVKEHQKQLCFD